jgi:hypothetical protein
MTGPTSELYLAVRRAQRERTPRVMWLRRFLCKLLRAHDPMLSRRRGRLCLTCVACGFQSRGWEIGI